MLALPQDCDIDNRTISVINNARKPQARNDVEHACIREGGRSLTGRKGASSSVQHPLMRTSLASSCSNEQPAKLLEASRGETTATVCLYPSTFDDFLFCGARCVHAACLPGERATESGT